MQTPVIEMRALYKRYADTATVTDINFTVANGSVCGLLGGNGAGKTTTLSLLLTPSSGQISIMGVDMLAHRYRVLGQMSFSSPYADLPQCLTVTEKLSVYAHLFGVRQVRTRC